MALGGEPPHTRQALANALSVNNVLTHLDLNGNECNTVVGKQAWHETARFCYTLSLTAKLHEALHEIEDLLQVNRGAAEAAGCVVLFEGIQSYYCCN